MERTEGNAEPEDHAGTLCEIMAGLAGGGFGSNGGNGGQIVFEKHVAPWMDASSATSRPPRLRISIGRSEPSAGC
ncbi:MAG: molecular chaperone TorD family protein [Pseudolabrys sp.]